MQPIAHLITLLFLLVASSHADSPAHYSYNTDGQLTSAQYTVRKLNYAYDPSGNLEGQTTTLTFPEGSIQSLKVSWVEDATKRDEAAKECLAQLALWKSQNRLDPYRVIISPDHPIRKDSLKNPHLKIQIQELPNLTFWIDTKSKGSLKSSLILENTESGDLLLLGTPKGEILNLNFVQTP